MTLQYRLAGTLLTGRVQLISPDGQSGTEGLTTVAEQGELGVGGVRIEDPSGTLTFNGYATFTVDETDCDPTRIWTGYVLARAIKRDKTDANSAARIYDCDLIDQNALLHFRVLRSNAAKRPAETDVARVAWLLTSEALSGLVYDRGLVSTANAGSFLEADCRRTYADDVIRQLAPSSVKNFFTYYDTATGTPALWYGKMTSTAWASLLTIRNDGAHDNDSVFAPTVDATLNREPHDVYSGVSYGWRGDPIYVTSAATEAAFIRRDAVYDTDRIGRLATAQQASKDWLNVRSGESDRISVSIVVKSSRVNWVYAGQRIQVLFTHLPGFTTLTWTRVLRRTVKPLSPAGGGSPAHYEIQMELWVPPTPAADATVYVAECPEIVQSSIQPYSGAGFPTTTLPAAPVVGDILFAIVARRGPFVDATALTPSLPTGGTDKPFTAFGAQVNTPDSTISALVMGWRVADGTEQVLDWDQYSQQHVALYEIRGLASDPSILATVLRADEQGAATSYPLGSFGSTGSLDFLAYIWNQDFVDTDNFSLGAGWTTVYSDSSDSGRPYVEMGTASGALSATATGSVSVAWGGFAVALTSAGCGTNPLPLAGEAIDYETSPTTPDGTTTLYSTTYPYKDGTLNVYVDGIRLVDADVTETDPVAGTYTLAFAPESDEQVETSYEAR